MLDEKFVNQSIKKWLRKNGWSTRYKEAGLHCRGVDIVVVNNKASRYFFIETKGESDKKHVNTNSIIFAVGQIVTRMKVIAKHAYLYGVGYPKSLADQAVKKIPYQFAKEMGFYIFSVNRNGEVTRYSWRELEEIQK